MKIHRRKISRTLNNPWDPPIQKQIKKLIANVKQAGEPFDNADVAMEIIVTALKAVQSHIGRGDLKLLSRSARELRYAFKIFKSYRNVRKVTIFGSARTSKKDKDYQMAKSFAKVLAANGYMVITGAGPGIMKAGNEGAGKHHSFGVNIRLPFEQEPNEFIAHQPTYIDCRYFFTRKLVFVKETSAAAFFPGGYGTLDEAFELLTLVQTGKSNPMPIIMIDKPGGQFWTSMDQFIRQRLLRGKKISREDLSIYKICHSVQEASHEIFHFYSNYQSIRYVDKDLVMRFLKPITQEHIRHLNQNFKDLLSSGRFTVSLPLEQERNEEDILHLHRLIFRFNRINNGRLRKLIDYMNR